MENRDEYLKRIRKKTTPIIFTLLLLIICGLFIQRLFERRHQATPPIKIYKTTQPEKTSPVFKHKVDKDTAIADERKTVPVETQHVPPEGVETHSQEPRESQPAASAVSNEKSNVENDGDPETEAENAKREVELAEWKAWNAEIDSILAESVQMQEDAKTVIAETVPYILEHLNTLSPEEQREHLRETKKMMVSMAPPGLQKIADENPDLVEQGWKIFVQLLVEQGYKFPRR